MLETYISILLITNTGVWPPNDMFCVKVLKDGIGIGMNDELDASCLLTRVD